MNKFSGKTCVVVGSTSGLGQALALNFLNLGARVIFVGRNHNTFPKIKARLPSSFHSRAFFLKCDITKFQDIVRLAANVKNQNGTIDLLALTAGLAAYKPFSDLTPQEIETVYATNLLGPTQVIRQFLPLFSHTSSQKWIIQVGSMAGFAVGHQFFSIYSASKQGLVGLFRSLLPELTPLGIKPLLVVTAGFKSELAQKSIGAAALTAKFKHSTLDSLEDVARGIVSALTAGTPLVEDFILLPTPLSQKTYAQLFPA